MTSISDLNSQMQVSVITDGMDRNSGSSRDGQKADFKSAFANATGQINVQNRDIRTSTNNFSGGDSDNSSAGASADKTSYDKPVVRNNESEAEGSVSKSGKSEDNSIKNESRSGSAAETDAGTDDAVVDEKEIEAVMQAVDLIVEKAAEILGVDVSEIMQACEDLTISTSDLVMPENMNMLAADIMGDGGLESLLTDQNILDTAGNLNKMAAEVLEEAGIEPAEAGKLMDIIAAGVEDAQAMVKSEDVPDIGSPVQDAGVPEDTVPVENAALNAQNDNNEPYEGSDASADENRALKRDDRHDVRSDINVAGSAQDMTAVQEPGTAEAEVSARPQGYLSNPAEVAEQVIEKIKSQVKDDFSSLELSLHPASLGNVAINLVSKSGVVTAQFSTETEAARAALESQIMVLRHNLEEQGVKIDAVEVTVSSHAFEQNLEQGNDGQSDAEASEQERLRRATRKIDLGDFAGIPEDIDEADAVTAQMMQADGNKMDYKV